MTPLRLSVVSLLFLLLCFVSCRRPEEKTSGNTGKSTVSDGADTVHASRSSFLFDRTDVKKSVRGGINWLLRHQSPDGSWQSGSFSDQCRSEDECDGAGFATHNGAVTALAVLSILRGRAFLGNGLGKRTIASVTSAVTWLQNHLKNNGRFRFPGEEKPYFARSLGALALLRATEIDQLSIDLPADRRRNIRRQLIREVRNVEVKRADAQLPDCVVPWYYAVIRSNPSFRNRMPLELVNKMIGILRYARSHGQAVTPAIRHIQTWLARLENRDQDEANSSSRSTTLSISPLRDLYTTYFGLKMGREKGSISAEERKKIADKLVSGQVEGGCTDGSWDPSGRWGVEGGRVYSTSMVLLSMTMRRGGEPAGTPGQNEERRD